MKNFFVGRRLRRVPERRIDDRWIEERLRSPETVIVVLRESRILFRTPAGPGSAFWTPGAWHDLLDRVDELVLLGEDSRRTYFAVELQADWESPSAEERSDTELLDLKRVATRLEHDEGSILAYAKAMTYWHRRHRFCGVCGSTTSSRAGGHLRICDDPDCRSQHFPRTDPAVIVLVTRGARCLLVRQPEWPENHFATVAGFVEPGEALEDAVRREIREEVGLDAREVRYHSSQPWPFPGSIMLGFVAEAAEGDVEIDGDEVEDARWFTRQELDDAVSGGAVELPPRVSISYTLINDWYAQGAGRRANLRRGGESGGWEG